MTHQRVVIKHDKLVLQLNIGLFEQLPLRLWADLIKYIANYKCESCGSTIKLESHHLDKNTENNCIANGVCLCSGCHDFAHNRINQFERVLTFNEVISSDPLDPLNRFTERGSEPR